MEFGEFGRGLFTLVFQMFSRRTDSRVLLEDKLAANPGFLRGVQVACLAMLAVGHQC